jgi:hypothetical protein
VTPLPPEEEERKRAIFERMSARRKERILKRGYDNWDPFIPPRDPLDLRVDKSRHTAAMLARAFLSTRSEEQREKAYEQGVWEICVGLISENERYTGMYEFSIWYGDFLKNAGQRNRTGEGA